MSTKRKRVASPAKAKAAAGTSSITKFFPSTKKKNQDEEAKPTTVAKPSSKEEKNESESQSEADDDDASDGKSDQGEADEPGTAEEEEEEKKVEKPKKPVQKRARTTATTAKSKGKERRGADEDDDDDDDEEKEDDEETEGTAPAKKKKDAGAATGGLIDYLDEGKWKELLAPEFSKPYFKGIEKFLAEEEKTYGADNILPPKHEIFSALNSTPFDQVRVVILGQDPYFRVGQAHGLAFSVRRGVKIPPSLNRMYNELLADIPGFVKPKHGYLQEWAEQGVLMFNATLTVREGKANTHEKCGWQTFTDAIIKCLNKNASGIVFLLWGGFAQKKGKIIDKSKHHVLEGAHPSPMAGAAWNGCKHFSKANALLTKAGKAPINWKISP
eukprot:TRINITY_DN1644_c0_g1_i2.p1 TRINITY_DN1644_c0_g1~~TRINITY_DN1644_c0_g1_i2.p1  ORF type:complete len:385 (-),score=101.96 TRINITY_DN1644_c0_g1_i2:118-1272(-)